MGCCKSTPLASVKKEAKEFRDGLVRQLEAEESACLATKTFVDHFHEFEGLFDPTNEENPIHLAYLVKQYYNAIDNVAEQRVKALELTVAEMGLRLHKVETAAIEVEGTKDQNPRLTLQQFSALRGEMLKDLLCMLVHRDMTHHARGLARLTDAYNAALEPVRHSMLL
eukprot:TRINITY_DN4947_c0_g2_i14.p2 TRINITY_DN4947_c0_g2~~TRINITY_DN4947_c0_g2_i14.p2  ORF type:complete len:168 (-),score=46.54 TRINITY_DN4947_c0_g2_i14:236-739(-)